jgi:hypothetical protein
MKTDRANATEAERTMFNGKVMNITTWNAYWKYNERIETYERTTGRTAPDYMLNGRHNIFATCILATSTKQR